MSLHRADRFWGGLYVDNVRCWRMGVYGRVAVER